MRCRSPTNFLRWRECSVQFERRSAVPAKLRCLITNATEPQLLAAAQYAFEHLNTAIDALRKPLRHMPLVISCEPTISMKWLIPRLNDFYQRHPDIQLHIFASGGPVAFQRDGVDVALRRNDFRWDPSVHAEKVCDEWVGPLCAPTLLKRKQLQLASQKVLHTSSRKAAWPNWRNVTKTAADHTGSQTYEHFYLTLQAACAGLGVAIGSVFMVGRRWLADAWLHRSGLCVTARNIVCFRWCRFRRILVGYFFCSGCENKCGIPCLKGISRNTVRRYLRFYRISESRLANLVSFGARTLDELICSTSKGCAFLSM